MDACLTKQDASHTLLVARLLKASNTYSHLSHLSCRPHTIDYPCQGLSATSISLPVLAISLKNVEIESKAYNVAACEAAKEVVWLRKFLTDLEVVPNMSMSITLSCDNSGVVENSKERLEAASEESILSTSII